MNIKNIINIKNELHRMRKEYLNKCERISEYYKTIKPLVKSLEIFNGLLTRSLDAYFMQLK